MTHAEYLHKLANWLEAMTRLTPVTIARLRDIADGIPSMVEVNEPLLQPGDFDAKV